MIEDNNDVAFDPGTAHRTGMPVLPPLTALLEILVLLVIPAGFDYFWSGFPSLTETQPHYFWLPVLLLSLQYGTVSGLLTAGIAIALAAALGFPDQEVGENHFSYLLRVWAQPVLWLAAALLLGQFRMRQIEKTLQLVQQVNELALQRSAIADYSTNLRTRCETLERELACRRSPAARQLLDNLGEARNGRLDPNAALGSCLEAAFGPCRGSLFVLTADGLHCVARHNSGVEGQHEANSYPGNHPIAQHVAQAGHSLCALVPGDEVHLAGEAIVAVPVLAGFDGRIVGVLKLEALEAAELDSGTTARLAVLAAQLSPLLLAPTIASGSRQAFDSQIVSGRSIPRLKLWRQVKWRRLKQQDNYSGQRSSRAG